MSVVTVLVEPDPGGHRFEWVSHLVNVASADGPVVLLTSEGATTTDEFRGFLADKDLDVVEAFDRIYPSAAEMCAAIVEVHRQRGVGRYVVMDADQVLKRWWLAAPRALRRRGTRPFGILMMSRFPPRLTFRDRRLLQLRLAKTALAVAARVGGAAQRFAYVSARDLTHPGWFVKRARDPALCTEHSRDRAALRDRLGLPADRDLVAVLGAIDERKQVPLVGEAAFAAGPTVDVVLAGRLDDHVHRWLDGLPAEHRARVHVRDAFHSKEELDAYTAASDVVAVVQLNPGPSGIMGKAHAAGVPTLTAGSAVRRREAEALRSGIHTESTVAGVAEGLRRLLAPPRLVPAADTLPTAEEFARVALGPSADRAPAAPLARQEPRSP